MLEKIASDSTWCRTKLRPRVRYRFIKSPQYSHQALNAIQTLTPSAKSDHSIFTIVYRILMRARHNKPWYLVQVRALPSCIRNRYLKIRRLSSLAVVTVTFLRDTGNRIRTANSNKRVASRRVLRVVRSGRHRERTIFNMKDSTYFVSMTNNKGSCKIARFPIYRKGLISSEIRLKLNGMAN